MTTTPPDGRLPLKTVALVLAIAIQAGALIWGAAMLQSGVTTLRETSVEIKQTVHALAAELREVDRAVTRHEVELDNLRTRRTP